MVETENDRKRVGSESRRPSRGADVRKVRQGSDPARARPMTGCPVSLHGTRHQTDRNPPISVISGNTRCSRGTSGIERRAPRPECRGWAQNGSDWPRAACLPSGPQCGRPDTDGGTGASAAADPTGDTDEAADVWLPRQRVRCDRKRPATGPRKAGRLLCAGSAAPPGQGWSAVGGGRRHVGWADTAASSPSTPRGTCRPAVHTRTARLH